MCVIYDTTLRDGEQMPGVVFSFEEKKELAHLFSRAGVNLIELMPAVSFEEQKLAKELIFEGLEKKLVCASRLKKEEINLAKDLGFENIILFSSLSDIHLEKKLNLSRKQNLYNSLACINYAKEKGMKVYFAGEDSSRAEENYLIDFVSTIQDKIESFLYCDTLGILNCMNTHSKISKLINSVKCDLGVHMHNDFGQAVSNTLLGIMAGAKVVSGTFTGIGERAGNAALEEVVLSLKEQFDRELDFNYGSLGRVCSIVEKYSSISVQAHKPVIGKNAFSHESGLHVDGIIKDAKNYEAFSPEIVGRKREIYFGKHSGISSLKYLFGNNFSNEEYKEMLVEIKEKAQREKRSFKSYEVVNSILNKVRI